MERRAAAKQDISAFQKETDLVCRGEIISILDNTYRESIHFIRLSKPQNNGMKSYQNHKTMARNQFHNFFYPEGYIHFSVQYTAPDASYCLVIRCSFGFITFTHSNNLINQTDFYMNASSACSTLVRNKHHVLSISGQISLYTKFSKGEREKTN